MITERASARRQLISSWPLFLTTILGAATAFYQLGTKGLWGDEVWVALWSQQQSLNQTFTRFLAPTTDLPLTFVITHLVTAFGQTEAVVRFPEAMLGALTVPVLCWIGRRAFDLRVGIIAAVLLAIAPYHVWYAQDARPYAGLVFFSLLSLACFWLGLQQPSLPLALIYGVSVTLDLYNHLSALLVVGAEGVFLIGWVAALVIRRPTPVAARNRAAAREAQQAFERRLQSVVMILVALATALVLAIPIFANNLQALTNGAGDSGNAALYLSPDLIIRLFGSYGAGSGWALLSFAVFSAAATAVGVRRRNGFVALCLVWLVVPLLFIWLTHPHHDLIQAPRYFLFMQPMYLLLVAAGIVHVAEAVAMRLGERLPGRREGIAVLLALPLMVLALLPTWNGYRVAKQNDWTRLCAYLGSHVRPGDAISGNLWANEALRWCFEFRYAAPPGVNVASTSTGPRAGARDHTLWFIQLGPLVGNALPAGSIAVPDRAWADRKLELEDDYAGRLAYPQSEVPATLYRLPSA